MYASYRCFLCAFSISIGSAGIAVGCQYLHLDVSNKLPRMQCFTRRSNKDRTATCAAVSKRADTTKRSYDFFARREQVHPVCRRTLLVCQYFLQQLLPRHSRLVL